MFKKLHLLWLVVFCTFVMSGCKGAENPFHMVPIQKIETQINGKYSQAQVRDAILKAGEGRKWQMKQEGNGVIRATYTRQGHTAVVRIKYSTKSYSIDYVSSENLYATEDGRIHSNYMRWIQNLNKDTQVFLSRN